MLLGDPAPGRFIQPSFLLLFNIYVGGKQATAYVALPSKNPLSLTSDDLEKNSIETILLYLAEALNAEN